MFWVDRIFEQIQDSLKDKIASGEPLLIRDEKTASGRVHVGSLRALALHGAIADRFSEAGIPHIFKYEINDFDVMDGLPVYLPEDTYRQHLGKLLCYVPSPDSTKAKNFADYYGGEYREVIEEIGYHPEFYHSTELYLSGKMNDSIRRTLERADIIRRIYKQVSGSDRPATWYPLSVICEQCGKASTTRVSGFDGKEVTYTCEPHVVEWTEGCGHQGHVSPFDGRAKLPWKVEWAAKWVVLGVDVEGGGKDHYSKGGARDVADHIAREVFEYEPPFGVPNEFFLVGGQKMSSSKGRGSSAREVADLVPPYILRLALLGRDISKQVNFDPTGDTIPMLFDQYDKIAESFWQKKEDDDSRLFAFVHPQGEPRLLRQRFLPRFSLVAFLVQMPHLSLASEVERMKGSALTDADKEELQLRAEYARRWLDIADEQYRFQLRTDQVPVAVRSLSQKQKAALHDVLTYIQAHAMLDGQELHTELHEIKKRHELSPADFFGALYQSFLGKPSGPKAGWFLSVLERDFLISRLTAVAE